MNERCDVVIIGAGPAGSLAAARLQQQGIDVLVIERERFPRFVIGESLLPQSMELLQRGGLLQAVEAANFQLKNGADFRRGPQTSSIDFRQKFTAGWGETFQVQRADFDKILADTAAAAGVRIRYGVSLEAITLNDNGAELEVKTDSGNTERLACRFVLDASGFGRVLPRLLDMEKPSDFPVRTAKFYHLSDNLESKNFDRDKILITIHPTVPDVWYWLIPFSNGTSSLGAVARPETWENYPGDDAAKLAAVVAEAVELNALVADGPAIRPVGSIIGYSRDVTRMAGPQFALLGNAGEFLDPVFSSGVTIAFKSADLVIEPLLRQLAGEAVNWETDYVQPLRLGIETFKAFVSAWYDGSLQKIILSTTTSDNSIKRMIVSILAGYAWDVENPFVREPEKYLSMVAGQIK